MILSQERKYDAVDGKIVNRATGKAIPDDEPIIIFRAKDVNAIGALVHYRDACADPVHRAVIQGRISDFARFQAKNPARVQEPDSDPSCIAE